MKPWPRLSARKMAARPMASKRTTCQLPKAGDPTRRRPPRPGPRRPRTPRTWPGRAERPHSECPWLPRAASPRFDHVIMDYYADPLLSQYCLDRGKLLRPRRLANGELSYFSVDSADG